MSIVNITDKADQKLSAYLRLAEGEISGFGAVTSHGGLLVVEDIFILSQESNSGHTELDADAMQELLFHLVKNGTDSAHIGLWWHSHGSGGTFFSKTDEDTIDRFAEFNRSWMLSLVSNRRLEHRIQLDYYQPIRCTLEDVEIRKISRIDTNFDTKIQKEIDRKVRKPEPKVYTPHDNGRRSFDGGSFRYEWQKDYEGREKLVKVDEDDLEAELADYLQGHGL